MKRIVLYVLILGTAVLVPKERVDVGKLRPIEVIMICKEDEKIMLVTDTEDVGYGETVEEAFQNMQDTSYGVIYLDTAEYLLITPGTVTQIEYLRTKLKGTTRICQVTEGITTEGVGEYLSAHNELPQLRHWKNNENLPVLRQKNGRLFISKFIEKTT